MPKKHGPCHLLIVGPEYLVIVQTSVENSVSIYRVTGEKKKEEITDQPLPNTVGPEHKSKKLATKLQDTNNKQYSVEQIACHATTKAGPQYVVSWNGYSSENYSIEPPEHLPMQIVDAYWQRE